VVEVRWKHFVGVNDQVKWKAHEINTCAQWTWDFKANPLSNAIVGFRVVKPYVEPEVRTGECWIYRCGGRAYFSYVEGGTKGRFVETRVNGKTTRFVWEADE